MVALGEDGEHRVSTLTRVTAALNTDLECLTTEYEETHEKLREAQDRIAQLEAQLAGQAPPPDQDEETPIPAMSPPRKRPRFGALGTITGLLG